MDSPAKPGVASRSMPAKEETRERKSLIAFTDSEWEEIVKAAAGVPPAIWIRLASLEKARDVRKGRKT
jgi:hypothetical protein